MCLALRNGINQRHALRSRYYSFEESELLWWWSLDFWAMQNSPSYYLTGRQSFPGCLLMKIQNSQVFLQSYALPAYCHSFCYDGSGLKMWKCKPGPTKYLRLKHLPWSQCLFLSTVMLGLTMSLIRVMWIFRLWLFTCIEWNLMGYTSRNIENIGTRV